MKAAGCVALALVLAFAGFLGLTGWLITRGVDQRGLTQRVDVTVLHPRVIKEATPRPAPEKEARR